MVYIHNECVKNIALAFLLLALRSGSFFFMVFGDMANGNHGVEPKIVELCILLQPGEEQVCFCFYYFCFFCFILFFLFLPHLGASVTFFRVLTIFSCTI